MVETDVVLDPVHPGEVVNEEHLGPLGASTAWQWQSGPSPPATNGLAIVAVSTGPLS